MSRTILREVWPTMLNQYAGVLRKPSESANRPNLRPVDAELHRVLRHGRDQHGEGTSSEEVWRLVSKEGANLNAVDPVHGRTALHWACVPRDGALLEAILIACVSVEVEEEVFAETEVEEDRQEGKWSQEESTSGGDAPKDANVHEVNKKDQHQSSREPQKAHNGSKTIVERY